MTEEEQDLAMAVAAELVNMLDPQMNDVVKLRALVIPPLAGETSMHLISAAPDLYEALEKITAEFEACVQQNPDDEYETSDKDFIQRARRALAKARGEYAT